MTAFAVTLMVIAMLMTLGIVAAGVISMARGGAFNQRWANRLMRARVVMQLIALVLFVLAVFLLRQDPS